jgi:hypothetical protein
VATFGDKPFSNRLLDQVGMHLVPASLAAAPFAPPSSSGIVQTAAPALATPPAAANQNPSGQTAPPPLPSEPTPIKK